MTTDIATPVAASSRWAEVALVLDVSVSQESAVGEIERVLTRPPLRVQYVLWNRSAMATPAFSVLLHQGNQLLDRHPYPGGLGPGHALVSYFRLPRPRGGPSELTVLIDEQPAVARTVALPR
ncbi:MAG: hypothetical protein K6U89_09840 [Chloroflexi bacterium]|nr:hypothetical protein [Chloroflexota bacterium]GIW09316.1 MAG: hypothetical protein KatS3mg061_0373 [Dehalococcoidia bacterium]